MMLTEKADDGARSQLTNWIYKNYDYITDVAAGFLSVLYSIIATFLYDYLNRSNGEINPVLITVLVLIGLLAIVSLSRLFYWFKQTHILKETYTDFIKSAYLYIQNLSFKCRSCFPTANGQSIDMRRVGNWALKCLQLSVDSCYDFFINSFGNGMEFIEEVRFEVTFMTQSYKDEQITIPCARNRECTVSQSMLLRSKIPDTYMNTITAELYREYFENKPISLRIIADTSSSDYHFIYEEQKRSAKSQIVVPVLSSKSELLGTLVVYCDSVNFFQEKDRKFWEEMMKLYTAELGIYKLILDSCPKEDWKPF